MPKVEASIRDDPNYHTLWLRFRAEALKQGKTARQALKEAIELWLVMEGGKKA